MHAAKVAALNKRLECYRLLDSLYFRLRTSNPEYVKTQQTKAIKMLDKRLQKAEKMEKGGGNTESAPKVHKFGGRRNLKKSLTSSRNQEENETFFLKDPNKKESPQEEENPADDNEDEENDIFDPIFASKSARSTLRPLPKITSGAMLQTLTGIGSKSYDDSASTSSDPLSASHHKKQPKAAVRNNLIGTIEPINPTEYEIENDSPLVTFLHSVDAYETGGILLQEKMDLTSLQLCSEEDLKSIGLALGPRKRIMDGILKRASVLSLQQSSEMSDTDL